MSRHGEITEKWADGEHVFRLAIGQLRELQEKTNAGPLQLFRRFTLTSDWRIDDVRETIRLALIGGGMKPTDALKLVERYVDERPLLESIPIAIRVMEAILLGVDDDPIDGKKATAAAGTNAQMTGEKSSSPASTASALQ
jgi:hypothetical protein